MSGMAQDCDPLSSLAVTRYTLPDIARTRCSLAAIRK